MKKLSELCNLLITQKPISLEDALDFLKLTYPIHYGKPLNEAIAVKALRSQFSTKVLQHLLDEVSNNPAVFGLEIVKLISKEGKTIKISINESNSSI